MISLIGSISVSSVSASAVLVKHHGAISEISVAYTYNGKSWYLVGFEPTLFGLENDQPKYAYQSICEVPQVWWRHCKLSRQYEWKSPD